MIPFDEEALIAACTRIAKEGAPPDSVITNDRDLIAVIGQAEFDRLVAAGRIRFLKSEEDLP